jgi:hypothetical protein
MMGKGQKSESSEKREIGTESLPSSILNVFTPFMSRKRAIFFLAFLSPSPHQDKTAHFMPILPKEDISPSFSFAC